MDLGAPVLDVQQSIVDSSDTSSAAATTLAEPEILIQAGQSVVRGYAPLVVYEQTAIDNTDRGDGGVADSEFTAGVDVQVVTTTTYEVEDKVVDKVTYRKETRKYDAPDLPDGPDYDGKISDVRAREIQERARRQAELEAERARR